jgi:hypothetical protein
MSPLTNMYVKILGEINETSCAWVKTMRYTISMYSDAENSGGGMSEKIVVVTKGPRVHLGV